jgi:hypothetical protein
VFPSVAVHLLNIGRQAMILNRMGKLREALCRLDGSVRWADGFAGLDFPPGSLTESRWKT